MAEVAQRAQATYLAFLAEVLAAEVDERAERRRQRRVHEARFPRLKRLADFDLAAAPSVNPATIATLAAGAYMDSASRSCCWATRARARATCSSGSAWRPASRGARCAMPPVPSSSTSWPKRSTTGACPAWWRATAGWSFVPGRVRLCQAGHPRIGAAVPNIDRERREIGGGVSQQPPFSEWGQVVPDPRLVAAIVDRVTFNAHIIETGTDSYRLRTTKARARKKSA